MDPKRHKIKVYTLSTCGWCKKTKALLNSLGVEYEFVDVDTLTGDALEAIYLELSKHSTQRSFPTMIIDDGKRVIIGFKEDEIRQCLSD